MGETTARPALASYRDEVTELMQAGERAISRETPALRSVRGAGHG
jgi:hypothetical protein